MASSSNIDSLKIHLESINFLFIHGEKIITKINNLTFNSTNKAKECDIYIVKSDSSPFGFWLDFDDAHTG